MIRFCFSPGFIQQARPVAALLIFLLPAAAARSFQTPSPGSCFIYPAPATGDSASVVYDMPQNGSVEVRIYNEAGDLVLDVTDVEPAGVQRTGLDLTYVRKGVYLCQVLLAPAGETAQILKIFKFSVVR
jgi:hypothetical protein